MKHYSPDRPARFYQKWLGADDTEPPITDEEFGLFQRYRDGVRFVPDHVADALPPCPVRAKRSTRAEVRRFVGDPRLPAVLRLIEQEQERDELHRKKQADERAAAQAAAASEALRQRLKSIDEFHDNQLNERSFRFADFEDLIGSRSIEEATTRMALDSYSEHKKNKRQLNLNLAQQGGGQSSLWFGILASAENKMRDDSNARGVAAELSKLVIRRSLVSMDDSERATLRMADVLVALGLLTEQDCLAITVPLVWNDGQCDIAFGDTKTDFRVRAAMLENLKPLVASGLSTAAGARERLNQAVRTATTSPTTTAESRNIIERYLFSGNRWMAEGEGQALAAKADSPTALRLGTFPGSQVEMLYDQRESLITVAPSGAGKSQSHVLRNLLYLRAPAVVLDVKGEMLRGSRAWREHAVGPTFAFNPQSPDTSIHYNPLDGIRNDPELAWEDARRLADLLVVPASQKSDQYFEARARDMITTALLHVALTEEGPDRSMSAVLDRLYLSDTAKIKEWCTDLADSGNPQLERQATALEGMPEKQRESIFDSARRQLEIWQSPAIARISADSTFAPGELRAQNATLYLAVALEDIKKFASVLRVLIGQTVAELYREPPESNTIPVTFFLDELPRLGRMDVLEEALDAGRGYGVRLWMFCQNTGQLQTTYPNAQGMMSNCAVRCFMNPDEDAARWISENLGQRHGLLDGRRKPLVEPHQLTGTEFAKQIVVFSRGQPPARLDKRPSYEDPVCVARLEGQDQGPQPERPEIARVAAEVEALLAQKAPASGAEAISWDAIDTAPGIQTAPTRVAAPLPQQSFRHPFNRREIILGAGLLTLATLTTVWGIVQATERYKTEAEMAALQASLATGQQTASSFTNESNRMAQNVRIAEGERDEARRTADAARSDLQREKQAHTATLRELESERRKPQVSETSSPVPPSQRGPTVTLVRSETAPAPSVVFPPIANAAPMAALPAPQAAPTPAPAIVTDCDLLAANPNDTRRIANGVKFPELRRNPQPAIEACDRAVNDNPGELRLLYQKARALHAARDTRVLPILDQLMASQYPSAFDNAAQLKADAQRWLEAEVLYRRGIRLGDPDAMVALADRIRDNKIPARTPGEDATLYDMAAAAGHQGAKDEVAKRNTGNVIGDVLIRSILGR
ncbi:type IV secretory system conjugative DNA transfer family protein [Tardiphaga sp. 804_B3_N1_9]|uniref:type IV secretory system conjugative DNA transfer family protein n=1 Tax=Tardiphaga sp. 804_B3_N1_9 TaxID=3240786 RepID=UPI003F26B8A0